MSMLALELLRRLYVAGVDVEPNDAGGLRLTGYSPPPDLVDELKAQKEDVRALLEAQGTGTNADGLQSALPRRYATPPGCLAPRACPRIGPCSRFLSRRLCDGSERTQSRQDAAS
jgi:hypothetical protein